jgi:DNA-binding HxlR family transcriptional regulator
MSKARILHANWKNSMLSELKRTTERQAELKNELEKCNKSVLNNSEFSSGG